MGPRHMSEGEVCKVEELQKAGWQASAILQTLQKARRKAGELGWSLSGVYRAMNGEVYKCGATEQRGRPTQRQTPALKRSCGESTKGQLEMRDSALGPPSP